MSKLTALFRLTFIVLFAGAGLVLIPACDAEFGANSAWDKGFAAYEKGDYATALRKWQPLAEQGDAAAQNSLGWMYYEGKGVLQDDKAAVQWYRRAAEQGDAAAQFNLGNMYAKGRGVPQDDKAAAQWYRRAAEQGNAAAQFGLGWMYVLGKGVPKDDVHAHMWANIAASGGHKVAVKLRNLVEKEMTLSQITEAQKLARECIRKEYKNCD